MTIKVTWQGPATGPVFVVTMDTHSVALDGYDLAALSSLATDKGVVVSPSSWEAPRGGHHRKGTLSFPEVAPNGAPVLDPGTQYLELTIRDVDGVAERTFRWEV